MTALPAAGDGLISEADAIETLLSAKLAATRTGVKIEGPATSRFLDAFELLRDRLEASVDVDERRITSSLQSARTLPTPSLLRGLLATEQAWRRIEGRYGMLTGEMIATARSRAKNQHAYASGIRKRGLVLGVERDGAIVFPAFQFSHALKPLAVMKPIIATLRAARWDDASILLWLAAPHGALGHRPADLLADEPERVLALAEDEAADTDW